MRSLDIRGILLLVFFQKSLGVAAALRMGKGEKLFRLEWLFRGRPGRKITKIWLDRGERCGGRSGGRSDGREWTTPHSTKGSGKEGEAF